MFKNVDGCMELNCVKGRFRKEIKNNNNKLKKKGLNT
jgi:hypothetical protein